MYPEKLEADTEQAYFSEEEYFEGKFNYIHTYLHTNYKYKMHSHQFYEINIIASGKGRHYIESTHLDAVAGDVFIIPPDMSHGYFSEERLDIYHILIKKDFFARYAEELSEVVGFELLFDIEPRIRRSSGKELNLNVGLSELAVFQGELERMMAVEKSRRYVYLNALAMAFICRLCKRISRAVSVSKESDIVSVMEYIKANLESKLTLDGLCAFAHVSSATLNRRFRATVGQSPMEYVLSARVARARALLEEGGHSRTEIAYLCGFYDLAHMNKYL